MSEHVSRPVSTGFFSIREVGWVLGVGEAEVCRLIRVGVLPAVRRRGRLVVPAHAVALLLPAPGDGGQR
ncbi:helix-turn-helix domain-containing protein [Amycolatopsis rubida]|uniref:Helix-turn-helix domain-containing protein n=1 Tax=Amycolatopsis rubida TaxID=112413 RepID=A0A1I6B3G7_9PSEU|nr:helix-turn-helix domain-containing protein [Amycolatopsis rubida]SFQ75453.1 hypothetical protein SAMN05421854_1237 [Amycolatopsis rubida]